MNIDFGKPSFQYLIGKPLLVRTGFPLLVYYQIKDELNLLLSVYGLGSIDESYGNILIIDKDIGVSDLRDKIKRLLDEDLILPNKYIICYNTNLSIKSWNVFLRIIEDAKEITILVYPNSVRVPSPIMSRCLEMHKFFQIDVVRKYFNKNISVEQYHTMMKFGWSGKGSLERLEEIDNLLKVKSFGDVWDLLIDPFMIYYLGTKMLLREYKKLSSKEIENLKLILSKVTKTNLRASKVILGYFILKMNSETLNLAVV